ncbi:ArdC family protein [Caldifermentibacillus hisashii]|uniref:ArdC family protein n=1 Tax=Caldifermentibacillus hisashii TaxID=996558 RepID=UPI0022B9BC43|nr:ArdC family protein [Caldifermentibacillus hisashii]
MFEQKKGKKSIQERVEELALVLEEGVANFSYTPEEYIALLEMKALMPHYSFRNIIIAKAQFPHASYLASLKRWNELGRKVKKGSKAIKIFAPRFKKVVEEDGEEKNELVGFIPVPVFAYEQTEGEPLPIDKVRITLEGDSPVARNIIECAEILASKDQCPITYGDARGANGFYVPATHEIVVEESLSMNHRCKTLVHELVHSRVHRHDTTSSSTEKEVVAEGTAFIVCSYFGLDTSDYSFRYVYSWKDKKDENPLMKYGQQICTIAGKLINEFQLVMEQKEQNSFTHIA